MRTNHRCFFASGTDVVLAKHPLVPQDTILGVLLRVQEFLEWWEGVRMGFMWGVGCCVLLGVQEFLEYGVGVRMGFMWGVGCCVLLGVEEFLEWGWVGVGFL